MLSYCKNTHITLKTKNNFFFTLTNTQKKIIKSLRRLSGSVGDIAMVESLRIELYITHFSTPISTLFVQKYRLNFKDGWLTTVRSIVKVKFSYDLIVYKGLVRTK